MKPSMNADHHNGHDGQPLSAEAIQALLVSQSEQSAKLADNSEVTQQPLLKQPYGFGECSDKQIADMIDAAIW